MGAATGQLITKSKASDSPSSNASTQSNRGGTVSGAPNRGHQLSPLAYTILREARGEIGTDAGSQNSQVPVDESTIAAAVDRVLRRRNEHLDDIERAHVIIHLQRDLMGWGFYNLSLIIAK